MTDSSGRSLKSWWIVGIGVVVVLAVGLGIGFLAAGGGQDIAQNSTTTSITPTTEPPTTTTTEPPTTTTTTEPPTTTTTTEPPVDVAVLWIEAMAAHQFPVAEELSSEFAEQFTKYLSIAYRLDPDGSTAGITDTDTTETSVTWTYDDGTTIVYDNLVIVDGEVADFDRNGSPISGMVSLESGDSAEVADVTVTVVVVYHRPDPSYGHVTFLAVEVDNQSDDDVYGWDAELIGSDRRSVEVEGYINGSYAPGAISDDILTFLGSDLSEGGELWIDATYNVTVKAPVPAVPSTS